jgi:hypothetical protein
VIWVSLEGKNIHEFYQCVLRRSKGDAGRAFLNNIWDFISSVLQLLGSPHLASWVKADGVIDIEVILKALIAYRKGNGPKIIEGSLRSQYGLAMQDRRHSRTKHSPFRQIDELGCAKTLVAGILNKITKFKGTNYLYGQWNQLPQEKSSDL